MFFDTCGRTPIGQCDLRIGHHAPYRGHHNAAKACGLLSQQARKQENSDLHEASCC